MDYAIVRTGSRQYRVSVGDRVRVDRLPQEPGSDVDLDQVLVLAQKGEVLVGQPLVKGAKVKARVEGHGRGEKTIVFKYKPKVRYRRKTGHRQPYTELAIEEITTGGARGRTKSRTKAARKNEEE